MVMNVFLLGYLVALMPSVIALLPNRISWRTRISH